MKRKAHSLLLALALVLGIVYPTAAADSPTPVDRTALSEQTTGMIHDRIRVRIPDGYAATQPNLTGGSDRFVFADSAQSYEIRAGELYRTSTGDLAKDAHLLWPNGRTFGTVRTQNGAEVLPYALDTSKTGNQYLVQGLLVKHPDNTLLNVRVLANETLYRGNRKFLEARAGEMLASVGPGRRELYTKEIGTAAARLETHKPDGYAMVAEETAAGLVFAYHKVVPAGERSSVLTVDCRYDVPHNSRDEKPAPFTRRDTILGQAVRWQYGRPDTANNPPYSYAETWLTAPYGYDGKDEVHLHITIDYASEADRRELRKMAAGLSVFHGEID